MDPAPQGVAVGLGLLAAMNHDQLIIYNALQFHTICSVLAANFDLQLTAEILADFLMPSLVNSGHY